MSTAAPSRNQVHKPRKTVVLLRPVPGTSVIHELWAGTKLIVVFALGVLLTFYPGWVPIALVAALILATCGLAHIPRGVLPSIPKLLWFLLFLGGLTAAFAGGSPEVVIGSLHVGLGGLLNFLRITAVSIVLMGLGFLVSWTTNVSDVAPAVATLGRPLRRAAGTDRRLGGRNCVGAAGIPDVHRRVPAAVCRPQAATETAAGHPPGPAPVLLARHDRPAGRGHHRDPAPGRRDGGCDHRTRWYRPDLGGAVAAESA